MGKFSPIGCCILTANPERERGIALIEHAILPRRLEAEKSRGQLTSLSAHFIIGDTEKEGKTNVYEHPC